MFLPSPFVVAAAVLLASGAASAAVAVCPQNAIAKAFCSDFLSLSPYAVTQTKVRTVRTMAIPPTETKISTSFTSMSTVTETTVLSTITAYSPFTATTTTTTTTTLKVPTITSTSTYATTSLSTTLYVISHTPAPAPSTITASKRSDDEKAALIRRFNPEPACWSTLTSAALRATCTNYVSPKTTTTTFTFTTTVTPKPTSTTTVVMKTNKIKTRTRTLAHTTVTVPHTVSTITRAAAMTVTQGATTMTTTSTYPGVLIVTTTTTVYTTATPGVIRYNHASDGSIWEWGSAQHQTVFHQGHAGTYAYDLNTESFRAWFGSVSDEYYVSLGAVQSSTSNNIMGRGSSSAASFYQLTASQLPKGHAPPDATTTFDETSIFSIDPRTKQVSISWTNPDGTIVPLYPIKATAKYASYSLLYFTGDISAYAASVSAYISVTPLTMVWVPS